MNAVGDRKILVVEDDEDWYEIISEAIGDALRDLGREADFAVMHADDEQEALDLLQRTSFALVSMDIDLSDVTDGTSEGLDLLDYLETSALDTCSIIVSGEVKPQYILNGFQKYNILRFIGKAPWDGQELRTTVKSILLYTEALRHLSAGDWEQAVGSWEEACRVAPELGKRFKDVSVLVEREKLEATHRITGLPTGDAVDSKLRELLQTDEPWGILYVDVENLEEYYDTYGHIEGDSALKTITRFLQERAGRASFVGYPDRALFIVVVADRAHAQSLGAWLTERFQDIYPKLYSFRDLDDTGAVKAGVPELRPAIRWVSDREGPFTDIREISRMGSGSVPKDCG